MKPAECRLTTTGNAQILFIKNKSDAEVCRYALRNVTGHILKNWHLAVKGTAYVQCMWKPPILCRLPFILVDELLFVTKNASTSLKGYFACSKQASREIHLRN